MCCFQLCYTKHTEHRENVNRDGRRYVTTGQVFIRQKRMQRSALGEGVCGAEPN